VASTPFYLFIRGPDLIPRHSPRQDPGMLLPFLRCLVSAFKTRCELALENLALRQQLAGLRRRIVHFNVTEHPSAEWTAQQLDDSIQPINNVLVNSA